MNQPLNSTSLIIAQIVSAVSGSSVETIEQLIAATNPLKGCKFISIKNYNSDASDNTELANHVINIGFMYENMKKTDKELLKEVNLQEINVDNYNYGLVNTGVFTLPEFKRAVKTSLKQAFDELTASNDAGPSNRTNNDIFLNKCLVFNTNTRSLSIIGQSVTKSVTLEAEPKVTKKAAKTVAKELIKKAAKLRTDTYRRFKIDNLNEVKISGETIEIL